MGDIYLFIDGAYLRGTYQNVLQPVFGDQYTIGFSKIKDFFCAKRAFYYDCLDNIQKPTEKDDEFKSRLQNQEEFFDYIRSFEGYRVREGYLAPGRMKQQKEVDVLLTVDMMKYALNGNIEKAVLISGDRDFKPVIEAVAESGTYVQVCYKQETGSKELAKVADEYIPLDMLTLIEWTSIRVEDYPQHDFPSLDKFSDEQLQNFLSSHQGSLPPILLRKGVYRHGIIKREIKLYQSKEGFSIVSSIRQNQSIFILHKNLEKLEDFVKKQLGSITWK